MALSGPALRILPALAGCLLLLLLTAARAAAAEPHACIVANPWPRTGRAVEWDASCSKDPDGTVLLYQWDLDEDNLYDDATGAKATWSYATPGTHAVRVRVTDAGGESASYTMLASVFAMNRPPSVGFGPQPRYPLSGAPVMLEAYTSDLDGEVPTLRWDLDGDGAFDDATGAKLTTSFTGAGRHTVALRATDDEGSTSDHVEVLHVSDTPGEPDVNIAVYGSGPGGTFLAGRKVTLRADTLDYNHGFSSYAWDLDGDGQFDDATGSEVVRAFPAGKHRVEVTATDFAGVQDRFHRTLDVREQGEPPTVTVSSRPLEPRRNRPVEVRAEAQYGGVGIDSYAWDLDGDGQFDDAVGASADTTFESGPHTVRVRAALEDGRTVTGAGTVVAHALNRPPLASVAVRCCTTPRAGAPVDFDYSARDPEGDDVTVAWDLNGDGQYDGPGDDGPPHAFQVPGDHSVRIRVTDANGASRVAATTVHVAPANEPPTVELTRAFRGPARVGRPVAVMARFSRDPDGGALTFAWDLDDDGQFDDATDDMPSVTFGSAGSHRVAVRVTDDEGSSSDGSIAVVASSGNIPPTARIDPTGKPRAGHPFAFLGGGFDDDGGVAALDWDLDGDGQFDDGTGNYPSAVFDEGIHTVRLRVTDDDGVTAFASRVVRADAGNERPTANLRFQPDSPSTGEEVEIVSGAGDDGTIVSKHWDLDGDGEFDDARGEIARATFATAGGHDVAVRVTDEEGESVVGRRTVPVHDGDIAPTAGFRSSPERPAASRRFTLQTVSARGRPLADDADGRVVSYAWDTDDDGHFDDLTGPSPATAFATPGDHVVRLRVRDDDGKSGVTSRVVSVLPAATPPDVRIQAPEAARKDQSVGFAATIDDSSSLDHELAWDLDDDGEFDDAAGTFARQTFTTAGLHVVHVRATGGDWVAEATAELPVGTGNVPPTAAFHATPASPRTDEFVTFGASDSRDPDGYIALYEWDLDDDGEFDDGDDFMSNEDDDSVTFFKWAEAGPHVVRLRVTDRDGATDVLEHEIDVHGDNEPPHAVIAADPAQPRAGEPVDLSGEGSSDDSYGMSWEWDLHGDGSYDRSGQHAVTSFSPGAHTVRLRVTDAEGAADVATRTFDVSARGDDPTAAFSYAPAHPRPGQGVTFSSQSHDADGPLGVEEWDLDDDGRFDDADGATAARGFATAGDHRVTLRVVDGDGNEDTVSRTVTVDPQAPPVDPDPDPKPPPAKPFTIGVAQRMSLDRIRTHGLEVRFTCPIACLAKAHVGATGHPGMAVGDGLQRLHAPGKGRVMVRIGSRAIARLRKIAPVRLRVELAFKHGGRQAALKRASMLLRR